MKERHYYDSEDAVMNIAESITKASWFHGGFDRLPTVLCVGTDRGSGDSLGPRVGQYLKAMDNLPARVIGDINDPLHATNLKDTLRALPGGDIKIIVDAGLGKETSVGAVIITDTGLAPGKGVDKDLGRIDGIGITGIVNASTQNHTGMIEDTLIESQSMLNYMILMSTRLSVVESIARVIANAISYSLAEVH